MLYANDRHVRNNQLWKIENAFSAGHYYRNTELHKESFNALVQFRIENIASGYIDIDPECHYYREKISFFEIFW